MMLTKPPLKWLFGVVAALLVILPLVPGCGGSAFQESAKQIIAELRKAEEQADDALQAAFGQSDDTSEGSIQFLQASQEQIGFMATAVSQAQSDLRELQPPSEAALAFQTEYLEYLDAYAAGIGEMALLVDYMLAAFRVLDDMFFEPGDTGLWADVMNLTSTGVDASNAEEAADLLRSARALTADCEDRWEELSPPPGLEAVHGNVTAALVTLKGTFGAMADLANALVDPDSGTQAVDLSSLWQESSLQWDTMMADVSEWADESYLAFMLITVDLDDMESLVDELEKDLSDL